MKNQDAQKEVSKILRRIKEAGIKFDENKKIQPDSVFSNDRMQMIRNILKVLDVGVSEKVISEL